MRGAGLPPHQATESLKPFPAHRPRPAHSITFPFAAIFIAVTVALTRYLAHRTLADHTDTISPASAEASRATQ